MPELKSPSILSGRKFFNYQEYKLNIEKLISGQESEFPDQTPDKSHFLPINLQRMKRMEKTVSLHRSLQTLLLATPRRLLWVVLVEPWCGDGAQNLPVLNLMAQINSNIDLKIMLRDSNRDYMDMFLTHGKSSIPKLICYDTEIGEELFLWGPRPSALEKEIMRFKEENPGYGHDEFLFFIHSWYAKDKGNGIQDDFEILLSRI